MFGVSVHNFRTSYNVMHADIGGLVDYQYACRSRSLTPSD